MMMTMLDWPEHPMYPVVCDVVSMMGHACHHPEDEKSTQRLEQMDVLARITYKQLFADIRTREEYALFIAVLMTIYHEQFIERKNAAQETKNAPTLVKRNPKGR